MIKEREVNLDTRILSYADSSEVNNVSLESLQSSDQYTGTVQVCYSLLITLQGAISIMGKFFPFKANK